MEAVTAVVESDGHAMQEESAVVFLKNPTGQATRKRNRVHIPRNACMDPQLKVVGIHLAMTSHVSLAFCLSGWLSFWCLTYTLLIKGFMDPN